MRNFIERMELEDNKKEKKDGRTPKSPKYVMPAKGKKGKGKGKGKSKGKGKCKGKCKINNN